MATATITLSIECDEDTVDHLSLTLYEAAEACRKITHEQFDHGATVEVIDSDGTFQAF